MGGDGVRRNRNEIHQETGRRLWSCSCSCSWQPVRPIRPIAERRECRLSANHFCSRLGCCRTRRVCLNNRTPFSTSPPINNKKHKPQKGFPRKKKKKKKKKK